MPRQGSGGGRTSVDGTITSDFIYTGDGVAAVDDYVEISLPPTYPYGLITLWGKGVYSIGHATAAQIAGMAAYQGGDLSAIFPDTTFYALSTAGHSFGSIEMVYTIPTASSNSSPIEHLIWSDGQTASTLDITHPGQYYAGGTDAVSITHPYGAAAQVQVDGVGFRQGAAGALIDAGATTIGFEVDRADSTIFSGNYPQGDIIFGNGGYDQFYNVSLAYGGAAADKFGGPGYATGGGGDDSFDGSQYADGGAGNDTFNNVGRAYGGAGADEFFIAADGQYAAGGTGADTFHVTAAGVLRYDSPADSTATVRDVIDASVSTYTIELGDFTVTGITRTQHISVIGAIQYLTDFTTPNGTLELESNRVITNAQVTGRFALTGTAAADTITGFGGTSVLVGLDGNDTLIATAGTTTLIGGAGSDLLFGSANANVTFRYDAVSDSSASAGTRDVIRSFSATLDTIDARAIGVATGVAIRANGDGSQTVTVTTASGQALAVAVYGETVQAANVRVEHAPVAGGTLPALAAAVDRAYAYTLPTGLFTDPDAGDMLTYAVSRADGSPLPAWLHFDAASRTLSGTPDFADQASLALAVRATDTAGAAAVIGFTLAVTDPPGVVVQGTGGNDRLAALSGHETVLGGGGDDILSFASASTGYTGMSLGAGRARIVAPSGAVHILHDIEHVAFADGVIDLAATSALVDPLYYALANPDVLRAHVDATAHYAAYGWHEQRDPDAFFSTAGYLGANPDIRAAGMNPLDHYDRYGWREGRDPSWNFDTTLYLRHNPDVAAAGIDPLTHYLAYGAAEGRATYAAIGPTIAANGFDAEYYLLRNPDVAAAAARAGADPAAFAYTDYETGGWREGRDPNAWFDDKGYLSAYADVAAAGVVPLDHYAQFGWREGRDPSRGFDTSSYLDAYADVRAAGINPLNHYLQFGAVELRQTFGDGLF